MDVVAVAQNFYKTHTINNSVCGLFALTGLIYAVGNLMKTIGDYNEMQRCDARLKNNRVKDDNATLKDNLTYATKVYDRHLLRVGMSLVTATFFGLGTLNREMGWVMPTIAAISPSLWDDTIVNSFELPHAVKQIGYGYSSLADKSIEVVKPVLKMFQKAAGVALMFFVIQKANNILVGRGFSPISFVIP